MTRVILSLSLLPVDDRVYVWVGDDISHVLFYSRLDVCLKDISSLSECLLFLNRHSCALKMEIHCGFRTGQW